MRKLFFLFLCVLISTLKLQAQINYNSSNIYLQLKKLNVLGSVLYVAAHPDDENNILLPYLAKEKLYRTAYLSLTRGDGGQNLLGSEQGIALGLIRSEELLAAREIDGAEQYFSSAYEFGFSKSASEALRIWDSSLVLSNMVWVIRKYQPDIIITRFPGDARAGHGHHAASAILANIAFYAAADSTAFVDQFKLGVKPWKAKRILWNTFNFGGTNTTSDNQLKMDVGVYNPLLGESYGEVGGEARSMHKSQGEGRAKRKGSIMEYFLNIGGDTAKTNLMEGIDITWNRLKHGSEIGDSIQKIIEQFNFNHPEYSVNSLVHVYKQMQLLSDGTVWWNKKIDEVKNLIISCSGIYAEATTNTQSVLQGDTVIINCLVNNRTGVSAQLAGIKIASDTLINSRQILSSNKNYWYNIKVTIQEPAMENTTDPYWLQAPQQQGNFTITNPLLVGKSWNNPLLSAQFSIIIDSVTLNIFRPVVYQYIDPVKGETTEPLALQPHLSITVSPHVALLDVNANHHTIHQDSVSINIYSNFSANGITTSLYALSDTTHSIFENKKINFEKDKLYSFKVAVKDVFHEYNNKSMHAAVKITVNNKDFLFTKYFATINYPHIPIIHYSYRDSINFVNEKINVVGKRVGYINGAGDKVADALLQLGYSVKVLNEQDITDNYLKQFDAIVIGIRAYNMHEWLSNKNDVLNKYIANGGNLVVQYLKSNQVDAATVKVGPYNFIVNPRLRITDENAMVNFLIPNHPALNYPNKIIEKDFDNWVQERSTYQAEKFDSHFEAILGMHDKNEKETNGSLIISKYGKGNFVYVSLVLFRQLPTGNAGAYKLLANLIALPNNK